MTAQEYIEKCAADGLISSAEREYLLGLAGTIEKTAAPANWRARARSAAEMGALGALALGTVVPFGSRVGKKIMDPYIERRQFANMMNLPAERTMSGLDPLVSAYSAPAVHRNYYVDPELTDEEKGEHALRKAFGILRKFAPEIAAEPELARTVLLEENSSNEPLTFMRHITQNAKDIVALEEKRTKTNNMDALNFRNTADGLIVADRILSPNNN